MERPRARLVVAAMLGLVLLGPVAGCGLLATNRAPIAALEAEPTEGDAPLTVTFDGSASFDADDEITSFRWAFGDGTSAQGPRVTHTYEREGLYEAELAVVDTAGQRDTARVEIVVGNPPPQAVLSAAPTHGWAPLTVTLDASASSDPTGQTLRTTTWELGDGTTAEGAQIRHTYRRAGRFDVTARVTDAGGATSEATVPIHALDFATDELATPELERSPTDLLVDDLDGDGTADLAVPASESDELIVAFGRAEEPAFEAPTRLATGRRPVEVAAGDLTGNGRPDLVTANLDSGGVSWFVNRGDRRFEPRGERFLGRSASALATGDLNADGSVEVAVADPEAGLVRILAPTGTDAEDLEVRAELDGLDGPAALRIRDVTGDDTPDLIAAGFRRDVLALVPGGPMDALTMTETWPVGAGPTALRVGDLDADGTLDIAVVSVQAGGVTLLFGRGGGRFEAVGPVSTGSGARSLVLADVDGDGARDLASANSDEATISVHRNNGRGVFDPGRVRAFPVSRDPTALGVADLDGSGFPDLVAVHVTAAGLTTLLNSL